MKRISLVDIIILFCTAVFVAFTLVPAVARIQRTPLEAKCQSNMHRWAEAMALYCGDYQGRFPTNRLKLGNGTLSLITPSVNLSPDALPGQPQQRFVYGLAWVEALYAYLEKAAQKTGQDWNTFKKCPAASTNTLPELKGPNYRVTYVFNRCLAESRNEIIRRPRNLMMMRELGRLTTSLLRPSNDSTNASNARPVDPFLIARDTLLPGKVLPPNEYLMHANGSHIVFADGHVKAFDISYFATDQPTYRTQASAYDSSTQQWYNYVIIPTTTPDRARHKSIAISP